MKNLVLSALIVISSSSFATSIRPVSVRLQLVATSLMDLHHLPVGQKPATLVTVDQNYVVRGAHCTQYSQTNALVSKPEYKNCHDIKVVETLSRQQQIQVESLIEEARAGKIELPNPHGIHCLAIPVRGASYTADNNEVLLKSGSFPCGSVTRNTSKAAQELVEKLNNYEAKYNSLFGEELN